MDKLFFLSAVLWRSMEESLIWLHYRPRRIGNWCAVVEYLRQITIRQRSIGASVETMDGWVDGIDGWKELVCYRVGTLRVQGRPERFHSFHNRIKQREKKE